MKPLFEDTTPEAEQVLIEMYRRMPDWRKLQCAVDLNKALAQMQRAEILRQHPDADEREIKMRLASRWLEPELMRKVFGWDPEEKGY